MLETGVGGQTLLMHMSLISALTDKSIEDLERPRFGG